jgi:phospholipase C
MTATRTTAMVALSLAALAAGCYPPPPLGDEPVASDAARATDAEAPDGSSRPDAAAADGALGDAADGVGAEVGACVPAPPAPDPLAAKRAACTFGVGALPTETLPLTEAARAALPLKHVIIVMKENRSFDHLLGSLHDEGQPATEAIPATFSNPDGSGQAVAPFHLDTSCVNQDPGHQWDEMHRQVNGGAMDGFVASAADTTGTDGHFVMGNYTDADLPFYYWLANTYALNDRHFPSVRSGTWPNRSFLLLGTADGVRCSFCGRQPDPKTPTIFGSLDRAGVTWAAYTDSDPFDGTLGWTASHPGVHTFADFQKALRDGTLPAVSFVDALGWVEDEHPTADVQVGENWTRIVYEAVVASPLWPSTAMIWTYDESGGFADHVPPPNSACIARPGNPDDAAFFELGARVPLAVISPYARPHYVSHVVQDHTSITRFIETVFGLPALTSRDANSSALLDMFDFSCAPPLMKPPEAPVAGTGECHGQIVLTTDQPSYPTGPSLAIEVQFRGVMMPNARDRIGIYRYPRASSDVPTDQNPIEPVAWAYVGGGPHGHMAGGAPGAGQVMLDASALSPGSTWPLPAGLWIAYYLPADTSGQDGHTAAASTLVEVTP